MNAGKRKILSNKEGVVLQYWPFIIEIGTDIGFRAIVKFKTKKEEYILQIIAKIYGLYQREVNLV